MKNKSTISKTKSKKRTNTNNGKNSKLYTLFMDNLIYILIGLVTVLCVYLISFYFTYKNSPTKSLESRDNVNVKNNKKQNNEENTNPTETFSTQNNKFAEKEALNHYNPDSEVLIVYSYMDGCPYCIKFDEDVWSKVSDKLNGKKRPDGKTLKLMRVNTKHKLSEPVSSFPTIVKYTKTGSHEFTQQRTPYNFTEYSME